MFPMGFKVAFYRPCWDFFFFIFSLFMNAYVKLLVCSAHALYRSNIALRVKSSVAPLIIRVFFVIFLLFSLLFPLSPGDWIGALVFNNLTK